MEAFVHWLLFRFTDAQGWTWDSFDQVGSLEWRVQAIIGGWVVAFAIYSGPKLWREHGPRRSRDAGEHEQ
jgi:hypothetical protein